MGMGRMGPHGPPGLMGIDLKGPQVLMCPLGESDGGVWVVGVIAFEQKERDYLLWGCFRSSFASSSTPAGCLLELIHDLDQGARSAKSPCATSNKRRGFFSIQATLSPGPLRSSLYVLGPVPGVGVMAN
jgi:hypothetical protein